MTNKERYQRAFSVLHASGDCIAEAYEMEKTKETKRRVMPRLIAVCAAAVLVLGLAATAYAADVGGIRRTVQIWTRGDQTSAVLEIRQGAVSEYTLTYEDAEGNTQERGGGGVAFDIFGRERPLTEAEIMESLDNPEVDYREDGSVWVYYRSQKLDITDKFDADGVCYVRLIDDGDSLYMTVKREGGYAANSHSYPDPRSWSSN